MSDLPSAVADAGRRFNEVIGRLSNDHLDESTPCADYDVRGLCNHLLYWGPRLEAAARRQPTQFADAGEEAVDLVRNDWRQRLVERTDGLVDALSTPEAWQGMTRMNTELPAEMVGSMVLCEFVVHGWDLARAIGLPFDSRAETAEAIHRVLVGIADQGRQFGAFGPEVAVAEDATMLERALALSGRDPQWGK